RGGLQQELMRRRHARDERAGARVPSSAPVRETRMRQGFLSWSPKTTVERGTAAVALVLAALGPLVFNQYWAHQILIETFLFGIAAASLIFLSAYGGMVSLAQTALFGIAGVILGNLATRGGPGGTSKGLHLGWDPTVPLVVAIAMTTAIGLMFAAIAARSIGIYFQIGRASCRERV